MERFVFDSKKNKGKGAIYFANPFYSFSIYWTVYYGTQSSKLRKCNKNPTNR